MNQKTNIKPTFLPEILEAINKDASKAVEYKDNFAFKTVLKCAFDVEYRFNLPEGAPPFKPSAQPLGMAPVHIMNESRRFYIFTKFSDVQQRIRREQLFVQLLEAIHPTEAKILIAVKDQVLDSIYPKITAEFVKANFPDVLPEGVVVAEPAKKATTKKVKSAEKVD
jgi:hypothetical protein